MRKLMLMLALVAALTLTVLAVSPAAATAARPTVVNDGGGDSQCQSGTVLNWYSWRWFAYVDGGGYVRLWDDVYSCDGGHYVYVGGFWA